MADAHSPARLTRWTKDLAYGGDYNPEQWSAGTWHQDVGLMRQAGVNTATVGVFSWSSLEPAEGVYDFDWLDKILDLLHENEIRVVLATPTASPPPWFSLAHPEALPVRADGVRLLHGSRDTYNPAAPAYRAASRRIATALARRYADHPALAMWHVHNEYGTVSYGPVTDAAFRTWLAERYGSLECLNQTWNTAFWSQRYGSWEQIFAPQATQYLPNPAHVLDFKRFSAEVLTDCLREQVQILREVTPDVPVTTNFMLPTWNHYDQWAMAAEIDQVSIDHYPDALDAGAEPQVAFGADLARSFNAGRPWLLMEQATSLFYDYAGGRMHVKEPGRMRRHTLQYLARGATGSLFFQWRAPRVGAEFFHSAMVPHTGPDSRIFREITELGRDLGSLAELAQPPAGGRVNEHRVAIAWHPDAWWAAETPAMPSADLAFLPAVRAVHHALWDLGVNCDVVDPDGDLRGYNLILVPSMLTVSEEQRRMFTTFIDGGGHLGIWYFSGSTNEHLAVRPGSYSGAFADLAGIRVEEHVPLAADDVVTLDEGSVAEAWTEVVQLRGAQAVASYGSDAHPVIGAGAPAITRHAHAGGGTVHYFSTRLRTAALRAHLQRLCTEAGIAPEHPDAGDGLEILRRRAGEHSYLFALNHTDTARTVTGAGHDLLTGEDVNGTFSLAPGDVVVLRERTGT